MGQVDIWAAVIVIIVIVKHYSIMYQETQQIQKNQTIIVILLLEVVILVKLKDILKLWLGIVLVQRSSRKVCIDVEDEDGGTW